MLLSAEHVDRVRRTVGFSVTYDGYLFEGAPTGDWRVELQDAAPITMTRQALAAATRVPGRGYMVHQPERVGGGIFQLFRDEVLINTVGAELPATREQRLLAWALVPLQASANHTDWTLPHWDDNGGEPRDLELRAFTFDVDTSALHLEVREHSPNLHRPDVTDHMLSLHRVVSFAISVRYPHSDSDSDAERIEEAYVDGCAYYSTTRSSHPQPHSPLRKGAGRGTDGPDGPDDRSVT